MHDISLANMQKPERRAGSEPANFFNCQGRVALQLAAPASGFGFDAACALEAMIIGQGGRGQGRGWKDVGL